MTNQLGRWIPFMALLTLIGVVIVYQLTLHQTVKVNEYPINRTIKYSFTVKNPNNYPVNDARFWVYSPIKASVFQDVNALETSHPYRQEIDNQGNERLMFSLSGLPPFAQKTIPIVVKVKLADHANTIDAINSNDFLSQEKFIETDNAGIQKLARRLKSEKPKQTVERIYQWITRNIKNTGYVKHDLGALYALEHKSGDCSEFMYLFSALSRANGIPTRNIAGFVASENRVIRPADYHNWNEVYIDGEWQLIDTDKQVFMKKSSDYIAMRILGESEFDQNDSIASQGFFSSSENIQVSMN